MRKQKIIKMTASPLDPSLGGSFQPPATHNGDISIVFRGKNMSIHGWDGSAWSTIYTRNGNDKQFTFPHTYENYYVKSLTGSDETFSASFFSTGKYERSTPLLAGVQRDTKLYDIEEVPVYTASDADKLLTIMSDGSLRWLGINESYIVEVIGTGGETPVDSGTSHVSAHLEENGTLFGNAAIADGVLVSGAGGDYTRLAMTDDYRSSVNQTISFWFKSTYNPSNGSWMRFVHSHIIGQGPNGFFIEMRSPTKIYFKGATQGLLADNDPTAEAPYALNDGEWHQITVSWQDSGSEALRMWVDGQPLTVLNQTHVGSGADTKPYLFIGARQFGSPMEMDKVGITEEFIDDAEALARYNSEAPAGFSPTGAGTFLEEQTPMNTPYAAGGVSSVDNGVLTSRVGTAFLNNADVPEIDTGATEAVFSMWYNPAQDRLGLYSNSGNSSYRNFSIMQVSPTRLRIYSPIGNGNNIDLGSAITLNEWNHIVVTVSSNIAYSSSSSKSLTLKVYLNGQEIYSKTGNTTGTVRRNLNDGKHYFGALHLNWNTSEKGEAQFDFVEWVDNVSLTDAQILAMYNNGERGWSVADGAAS